MGLYSTVQSALDGQLATVSGIPRIVTENSPVFTPTIGTPYCLATLLPAQPSEALSELGIDGATYFLGLYQVHLFYPRSGGAATANTMADQLLGTFKRGTAFSANSINIIVRSCWRNPALADTAWWSVPVMVSWFSLTKP